MLPAKDPNARKLTVATTGASGSMFLKQMLLALEADDRIAEVNFVASGNALRVMAEELQLRGRQNLLRQLLGRESAKFRQHSNSDIGACIASGSYPVDAMIVIPCSMGTLAKVANGVASELIARAADVCLKERRPLVLCVREAPLNRVHLRNMLLANDAGATIYPIIPTFYNQPASLEEMARAFVNRVLQHIRLRQPGACTWKG
jgi:4-hydroxy-3-polyprenylbenzoate decarboxylase